MALENDILVRLRNGENPEKIAQELINNLNSAITIKDKEDAEAKRIAEEKAKAEQQKKAKEEQEKKAKEEQEKQVLEDKKNNLADAIASALLEYYKLTFPVVPEGISKGFNGPTVRKQLDSSIDLFKSLIDLSDTIDKIDFDKVEAKLKGLFGLTPVRKKNEPRVSYEDAISSFFRANGL